MFYRQKLCFAGIPLGFLVRGSIAKQFIYRVRRGNGFFGAEEGKLYQDKYSYFVPTSITNTQCEPYRQAFITAVDNWRSVLSDEEKNEYNRRATRAMHMSGYNLYVREYILANT